MQRYSQDILVDTSRSCVFSYSPFFFNPLHELTLLFFYYYNFILHAHAHTSTCDGRVTINTFFCRVPIRSAGFFIRFAASFMARLIFSVHFQHGSFFFFP